MSELLPDFQKFLLSHKLAPEKNIRFLAYWVSRFLRFAEKKEINNPAEYQEAEVTEFLDQLRRDERTTQWQARQADDAIRLYYFHYLGQKSGGPQAGACDTDGPAIPREARRLIRLKHYAYSTERTYLQWIERFLAYALKTGKKKKPDELDTEDIKNFLSHLALNQKVSSSTQNQAFNALLFLFRNVLGKETAGLGDSVRRHYVRRSSQQKDKKTPYQRYFYTECDKKCHEKVRPCKTRFGSYAAPQLRHPSSSGRRQHQGGAGLARA